MIDLLSISREELYKLPFAKQRYRYDQLFSWLHQHQVFNLADMVNLPKDFREVLSQETFVPDLLVLQTLQSDDGTKKLLFNLDQDLVEGVLLSYKHGNTMCLSTQVGCAMGCTFCASGLDGLIRNLSASEMLRMFYEGARLSENLNHLVLMGSGEPLDNYDEVMTLLRMLHDEAGMNLSYRNMTLSTCGIVPKIYALAEEGIPINLAISLHAPNDEIRRQSMPVARAYKMDDILQAATDYQRITGRQVTLEYALIKGLNDQEEHAIELRNRIRGKGFLVNLIPLNPVEENDYEATSMDRAKRFMSELEEDKIYVTIRRENGADILASCGQLRNQTLKNQ